MKKKILIVIAVLLCLFIVAFVAITLRYGSPSEIMQKIQNRMNRHVDIAEEIIQQADGYQVLLDHPKGYSLEFPGDMKFDITNSPNYIKFDDGHLTATVTREWAPYEDVGWYIENYLNNYILNERYIEMNNLDIHENTTFKMGDADARFISLTRNPEKQEIERQNSYAYFYVHSLTGKQAFFRVMFKTDDYARDEAKIRRIMESFKEIPLKGQNEYKNQYIHKNPEWNKETLQLYEEIKNSNEVKWGLFVDGSYNDDMRLGWLTDIEKKVDHHFDFSLHYVNLSGEFPTEKLQRMYDKGFITELTLQISYHANDDLFGKNPNFDVYDGLEDETIRSFARGAKEFGHPFLFRLNNEMNSDWVNYSGVAALSDPDIFVANWRRIHDIFREEGVDNCIWIYNPNAEDCPPCHWNSHTAYFPGAEYVDMIGMTGYNTGTYYADLYHEKWRTFDEIYREPYDRYMQLYGDFPFIITEFASSSIGGDKSKWITDMFEKMPEYPNIKMALWWSSADYDMRPETYKHLARPYFLDETEETTEAFKNGLKTYHKTVTEQNKENEQADWFSKVFGNKGETIKKVIIFVSCIVIVLIAFLVILIRKRHRKDNKSNNT